jgi:hypothetical protein
MVLYALFHRLHLIPNGLLNNETPAIDVFLHLFLFSLELKANVLWVKDFVDLGLELITRFFDLFFDF